MECPYCHREAEWVENKEIYGKNYGKSFMCYYCKDCDSYVGCHNNTRKPLGTMANKELRDLRIECHSVIDPLWKTGEIGRKELYEKLSNWWGKEFHIGELRENECKRFLGEVNLSKLTTK